MMAAATRCLQRPDLETTSTIMAMIQERGLGEWKFPVCHEAVAD